MPGAESGNSEGLIEIVITRAGDAAQRVALIRGLPTLFGGVRGLRVFEAIGPYVEECVEPFPLTGSGRGSPWGRRGNGREHNGYRWPGDDAVRRALVEGNRNTSETCRRTSAVVT
ncbi:hypothetical protein [Streptomyces sp. NRRL F-5755]|uniref:hypothetical protein n=1 Tax=Streptomyces sp. NRRL F-5755 TaxID=1519475 RepID=UPI000AD2D6C7|nr:hypothetical protein [Streptomyces sp. NRRL F-5755]